MGVQLGLRDYRSGLEVVQAIAGATTDVPSFARTGVELLARRIGAEITTLSECDLVSGRRAVITTPGASISAADRACFDRHFDEHPLVRFHAHDGGRTTHRISDSVPFTRFRNTSLYTDYYRRVGIDHAVALPIFVDRQLLVSFVLNRSRSDFTDRERAWLDAIRAPLAALYRNARALQQARVETDSLHELLARAGMAVVVLGPGRAVRDWTPASAAALRRYCGLVLRPGARLAGTIDAWLARLRAGGDGRPDRTTVLQVEHAGERLLIHALRPADSSSRVYLLLEEKRDALSDAQLARWQLTPREREILRWLALGKTDRDIAQLAGTGVRTVHKHLQRVYEKLGVETRTAAVMRALRAH
jgi:DNA-binding CsgD family transcriptional regulator